jgi:hypothetical protein
MLKVINCVSCVNFDPINYFSRIFPYESFVVLLFNCTLVFPSLGITQDIQTLD